MKEHNRLNFAGNIKHIYISLGYEYHNSSTKKSTEKAQLNAMPKPFYLRFIKFPVGITVRLAVFLELDISERYVVKKKCIVSLTYLYMKLLIIQFN